MKTTLDKKVAVDLLRKAGICNPVRVAKLMHETIGSFKLDLSRLTVLTEAASWHYAVTPVLAAMAGASKVYALTTDSKYANVEEVIGQTRALEALCDVIAPIEILDKRSAELFSMADIVTNLGFVRPIDHKAVAAMKPGAVIPLMCEAWEVRPKDVDVEACRKKGIRLAGTNEHRTGFEIFQYSGWLCLKMLFDAQIEVYKSKIVIVSSDRFGEVICDRLKNCAESVTLVPSLHDAEEFKTLKNADVLIVADYCRTDTIIGENGDLSGLELYRLNPEITLIQFAGHVEIESLIHYGIEVFPKISLEARRMCKTLASIGPRPVVELHTAGLKVGEILARRVENDTFADLVQIV